MDGDGVKERTKAASDEHGERFAARKLIKMDCDSVWPKHDFGREKEAQKNGLSGPEHAFEEGGRRIYGENLEERAKIWRKGREKKERKRWRKDVPSEGGCD